MTDPAGSDSPALASVDPQGGAAWVEIDSSDESWEHTIALGGSLSSEGRKAAIATALPLLGTYFSSGSQPLSSRTGISRQQHEDTASTSTTALAAGLRLRAAIAAADRLSRILHAISKRPTFRYATRSIEVVGAITGQLNVNRLATRSAVITDPPTYPVFASYRAQITPENVLAYYAGAWVLRELRESQRAAIPGLNLSPEYAAARKAASTLSRSLTHAAWSECAASASQVRRGGEERRLLTQVQQRLRRREVSNPAPYRELVAWIHESLAGDARALAGDIDWSFYGERFDTKLFEIWCLHQIAREVSRQLAVETPPADLSRRGDAAYVWSRPAGRLELHFQRAIPSVAPAAKNRWHREGESGREIPLRGIPDIVAQALRTNGETRLAILDPKLRQRSGPPTEELYKLLGYFANHGLSDNVRGCILFHTTSRTVPPTYTYNSDDGGVLLAAPLNPVDSQAGDGFQRVASMLLGLLEIPTLVDDTPPGGADDVLEQQVRARRRELLALADTLPSNTLTASRGRLEAQLGPDLWAILRPDVQTVLATAEHVGFSLEEEADYSGPILGVCAAVEMLVFDLVIEPTVSDNAQWQRYCRTLGQALAAMRNGIQGNPAPVYDQVRQVLQARQANADLLRQVLPRLEELNDDYRVPAAHRRLLGRQDWLAAWGQVLRGRNALLPSLAEALRAV